MVTKKLITSDSTTPKIRYYTTLLNVSARKQQQSEQETWLTTPVDEVMHKSIMSIFLIHGAHVLR